jgi:hypothetical protein
MEEQKPIDPCRECLVRVCCSETCDPLRIYLKEVITYLADNVDNELLDRFSSNQHSTLKSAAKMLKGMRKEVLTDDFKKNSRV